MSTEQDIIQAMQDQLKDEAEHLVDVVQAGDFASALRIISELKETRDRSLYQEVGKLTRSLHEAVRNFHKDVSLSEEQRAQINAAVDTSERLDYVIDMTNKAANKTLDLVEETMPIASELRDEAASLKKEWRKLIKREMSPDEFRELYKRIDQFLTYASNKSGKVSSNLSDILMAQDFQDLTGQVIQRVSKLIGEVESDLVKLVAMASTIDDMTGVSHEFEEELSAVAAEGPIVNAEKRDDVVSGQDDVDDLLSSLGF